jgi:hypothetical protein
MSRATAVAQVGAHARFRATATKSRAYSTTFALRPNAPPGPEHVPPEELDE